MRGIAPPARFRALRRFGGRRAGAPVLEARSGRPPAIIVAARRAAAATGQAAR